MLSHARLPKPFWGEAMRMTIDLINISPLVPLKVWSGKDVSYNHLKGFDCQAFIHVSRDERFKLDNKTK